MCRGTGGGADGADGFRGHGFTTTMLQPASTARISIWLRHIAFPEVFCAPVDNTVDDCGASKERWGRLKIP